MGGIGEREGGVRLDDGGDGERVGCKGLRQIWRRRRDDVHCGNGYGNQVWSRVMFSLC